MTRTWVLDFARPDEWISANHREHRMVTAAKTRAWRAAAAVHARAQGIPTLDRVHITAEPCYSSKRRRDATNTAPTVKACVDGLVDAGVLEDDDDKHVIAVTFKAGPVVAGTARLRLTIEEVPE